MKQIIVENGIAINNEELAKKNKEIFNNNKIFTINLLGSPGAGKTRLIEKLIGNIKPAYNMAVIEGDLYTAKDAMRIGKHNIEVIQLNTGRISNLDASMISTSLKHLDTNNLDFLIIENIGNLVIPDSYDLSEDMKIVVMSVTEGNDKPLKYPAMFKSSSVVILNKIDLIDSTDFDKNEFYRDVKALNKDIKVFEVSCREGIGIDEVSKYLKEHIRNKKIY
ncbi:MAG: hydrogenase nickel incorporation protein HypB [Clostridium sp.]|nr:hydrogenase nickel incorporation protein HypB [Clostridium sp.]